jgi:hypothetical protein
VAGEQQKMVAFVDRESKAASERADHLRRRFGARAALETGEVVRRHIRQLSYFLPSEASGSATWAATKTDVFRTERFAARSNERPQCHQIQVLALLGLLVTTLSH